MTVSQMLLGGLSDRIGRGRSIVVGCLIASIALTIPIIGAGMVPFILGGALYAVSISFVTPTVSALTIDLARPGRLGAAMATYSIGFQLANGGISLVWGAIVVVLGFPAPFIVGIALQIVTVGLVVRFLPRRTRSGPANG
jgi:MFS family permease